LWRSARDGLQVLDHLRKRVPQLLDLMARRLDCLENRPVAALVQRRHEHFINLFIWSTSAASAVSERTVSWHGLTVIHWDEASYAPILIRSRKRGVAKSTKARSFSGERPWLG
jgi:hypothetical protein